MAARPVLHRAARIGCFEDRQPAQRTSGLRAGLVSDRRRLDYFGPGLHRPHHFGFPAKEIIDPRPCVDFGIAFFAFETTGPNIRVLLLRRLTKQAAFRTGEYNRGLGPAGHQQSVHPDSGICQPNGSHLSGWQCIPWVCC